MELVERTALMAQLDGFLAEARTGSGCVVLLGGEAGVGKTSLARVFVTGDARFAPCALGRLRAVGHPRAPRGVWAGARDLSPLETMRTAIKRTTNPGFRGLVEAFYVQEGQVMAPEDLSVGQHSLQFTGRRPGLPPSVFPPITFSSTPRV